MSKCYDEYQIAFVIDNIKIMEYLIYSAVVLDFFVEKKYLGFAKVIKGYQHKKCCKFVSGLNTKHCSAEYLSAIV